MSNLGWACIGFGLLVCAVILAVCIWDPWAIATGRLTVSRWSLLTGQACGWFVALAAFALALPLGILLGHLWFPAAGGGRPLTALLSATIALVAGVVAGHLWFYQ